MSWQLTSNEAKNRMERLEPENALCAQLKWSVSKWGVLSLMFSFLMRVSWSTPVFSCGLYPVP